MGVVEPMVLLTPTPVLDAASIDIWGTVVPNYIAAAGGLAGTVLAILSLIYANGSKADASEALSSANSAREEASDTRAAAAAGLEIVSQPPVIQTGAGAALPTPSPSADVGEVGDRPLTREDPPTTGGVPTFVVRGRSPEDQAALDDVLDYLQGGDSDPHGRRNRWRTWKSRRARSGRH